MSARSHGEKGEYVEFFAEYIGFLAKTVTLVIAIVVVLVTIAALRSKGRQGTGQLQVNKLNDFFKQLHQRMEHAVLDKEQLKAASKAEAKAAKQEKKAGVHKPRVYVLDFDGDIKKKDLRIDNPYNTYKYKGLPPGPISIVSESSFKAALNPQDTDYLYFVSMGNGLHKFSKSLREHNQAVLKYQINAR